jgi:hypothetical protein
VLVDYVIASSHYERSFGYAQDDKVWRGIIWNGLHLQEQDSSVNLENDKPYMSSRSHKC